MTEANAINCSTAGIVGNSGTAFSGTPVTQFAILVGGSTSSTLSNIGPGTSGQLLQSGGASANPAYSTSTYPTTNAANTLLYASSANTMAALTTGNNGVLITSNAGVPSWLADGTTGKVLTATTGSPASWESPAASSISITGDSGGALAGNAFTLTGGTTGLTFSGAGSTETLGGELIVANGGTGVATLTGLALGSGTSAFTGVTYVPKTAWTPVLAFGGSSTGITYTTQLGEYQRIGNMVMFAVDVTLSSMGVQTGQATLSGFPVTLASPAGAFFLTIWGAGATATGSYFWADLGGTTANFWQVTASTLSIAALTNTSFTNTTEFRFSGVYFV